MTRRPGVVSAGSPTRPGAAAPTLALHEAEVWVFDLDNTLYPPDIDLFAQIDVRMQRFIADALGLALEEALALQKRYFREYGMSLRGLMQFHGLDPKPFLDYVHEIDMAVLAPAPALDAALARLPGRKLIYTNASARHAERVTERLGVAHHFEAVFDIVAADYSPKPDIEPYRRLIGRHRIDARAAVMIEDMARNLRPAAELGMTTGWVRNASEHGLIEADGDHIHHVIDDLTAWLTGIAPSPAIAR